MKKLKRCAIALIAAGALVACLVLAGCGGSSEQHGGDGSGGTLEFPEAVGDIGGSLAVIVQKTKNVPHYSGQFADGYVEACQEGGALFDLVILDGKPFSALTDVAALGSDAKNGTNRRRDNASQRSNIAALIAGTTGKTNEVDIVAGLSYADRSHASASEKGTTVIAASGISTAGALDLRGEGMLSIESDTAIAHVQSYGYDLNHTKKVVWYGFGDVAGEQRELTPALKNSLRQMYADLLVALGVEEVEFVDSHVATVEEALADAPSITAVDVPVIEPMIVEGGKEEEAKLSSDILPFVAGTAEFVDPEGAETVVAPFAEELVENPGLICTVAGSTAGYPWDRQYAFDLGWKRAQAVADLLIQAGVSEKCIDVVSFGDRAPDHVEDIDPSSGLQIPEAAQKNRWVSITLNWKEGE